MNYEELQWFKENVADPAMERLFANTNIPEGFCCIDKLDIQFIDGRSWGTDSCIIATGLLYKDGKVEEYSYEETDFDVDEFVQAHKDCVFLSDGKLHISNELEETEINSTIRKLDSFSVLYSGLPQAKDMSFVFDSIEFLKMKHILEAEEKNSRMSREDVFSAEDKILCYGCCDNNFFAIQQHQRSTPEESYFSLYYVDVIPKDMSLSGVEEFMIENCDDGGNVAGSWEQISDEFETLLREIYPEMDAVQRKVTFDDIIKSAQTRAGAQQPAPEKDIERSF